MASDSCDTAVAACQAAPLRPATNVFASNNSVFRGKQTPPCPASICTLISMQATRSTRFLSCLQAFVEKLHHSKQHFVPIVDPGIKIDPGYPAYDRGLKGKVFVNDLTGNPYVGQVNAAFVIRCCVIAVAVLRSTCAWLGMLLMSILLLGRRPTGRSPLTGLLLQVWTLVRSSTAAGLRLLLLTPKAHATSWKHKPPAAALWPAGVAQVCALPRLPGDWCPQILARRASRLSWHCALRWPLVRLCNGGCFGL